MKFVLAILFFVLTTLSFAVQGVAGSYRISLTTDPSVIPVGRAKLHLTVTGPDSKPVVGATIKVLTQMPGMAMGEREETASPEKMPGMYVVPAVFGMAGAYDAHISISGSLGTSDTNIRLTTGNSAEAGQQVSPNEIGLIAAAIVVLAVLIFRARKHSLRSLFNRKVLVPIVLLAAALGVALWAVQNLRRPGSMTPMEAQVMEMNVPAPEGTLPVHLVKAEVGPVNETVTYAGQAVGNVEQDVVARVTGAIVWMPEYVGDRVHKGQVIARLDTTQMDPMVDEKLAQTRVAAQGAEIAQSDYRKAQAEVQQAAAEEAIRSGQISEAQSMLVSAQQSKLSADASLKSEQASVADARAQLASAEADMNYWDEELGRSRQLYNRGALSRDEFQKVQASQASAVAKSRQAQAAISASQARVAGATAAINKAIAETQAAKDRLSEMQAEHHAHMAHVRSAQASAESAKGRITQATSEIRVAQAGLQGVATQRGYAEIKAAVDGVVTARLISPGVLVSAGQSILKIAQVSPIRLQANVPESDLMRIHLGSMVKVKSNVGSSEPISLTVTSVSPAVDVISRTGIVEALYPNTDGRFLPGQFLSMEIQVGEGRSILSIPTSAIQTLENRTYAWTAELQAGGDYIVNRAEIKVGSRATARTAVLAGLKSGQQLVLDPSGDLQDGMRVSMIPMASDSQLSASFLDQTIEITAAGYDPPSIVVPTGKPFKVTFIRRDAKSCGTEVIFPDLGIRRALPLNQKVTIEFPALAPGKELRFTCPMNMLNGKAVTK